MILQKGYGALIKNEDFFQWHQFWPHFKAQIQKKTSQERLDRFNFFLRSKFLYPMQSYDHKINPKLGPAWTHIDKKKYLICLLLLRQLIKIRFTKIWQTHLA